MSEKTKAAPARRPTAATLTKKGRRVVAKPDDVIDLDVEVVRDSRGRRITEADAARIAEETLAQVGRRPGRPSLTAAGQRSPQIAFRVSADVRRLAEQRAAAEGRTVSELARHALEQYVRAGRPNG